MKLILSILVIFIGTTIAMDVNKLFRDVQKETTKDITDADKVTLMSTEGQRFTLLNDVARQSETIKSMMQDALDSQREIPLQSISSATLGEIAQLLHHLYFLKDIKNEKILLDTLEKEVRIANPLLLLAAANYLDIPLILNFAARLVARDELKQSTFLSRADLNKRITGAVGVKSAFNKRVTAVFGESSKNILQLIAHYYFLLSEKKLQGVPEESYGFSVQDYLDYLPHLIKFRSHNDKPLDLGLSISINGLQCVLVLLQLSSLKGLQNVPRIHDVEYLTLQQNKLQVINASDFQGLNSLIALDLMVNQLKEVNLPSLPNLQFLALQENKLKEVTFPFLPKLKRLILYDNLLSHVPNSLGQLPMLQELVLQDNPMKKINQPEAFRGKRLLSVYIDHGQFSVQMIDEIKAVEPSIRIFENRWMGFSTTKY